MAQPLRYAQLQVAVAELDVAAEAYRRLLGFVDGEAGTDDEEGARFLDDQWRASMDLPIQCSSTPGTAASVLLTLLPLCFIRRRGEP